MRKRAVCRGVVPVPLSPQNPPGPAPVAGTEVGVVPIGTGPEQGAGHTGSREKTWSDFMATLSISERYRPAFLSVGKEWMVVFWVRHPETLRWHRIKEKLNYIRDEAVRKKFAAQRIRELNGKLAIGWNPILNSQAPRSATPIEEAIKDFVTTKMREEMSEDTMRTYRSLTGIMLEWLRKQGRANGSVGTFSDDDAIVFMDHCFQTRGITARTFNNYKQFFGTLALWWVKRKYLATNPFAAVEHKRYDRRKKNRRPLTLEERRMVREHLEKTNPRFLAFSLLMFHCALRPKEVFHLKPEHFDLRRQCIHVLAEFSKTNFERTAAIPDVLVPVLAKLGLESQDPKDYVFSTRFESGPTRKKSTYSGTAWVKVREQLQLPKEVKHYSLRDTGAVQLARDGVSRVDAQNHFDHHSSAMHDIYTRYVDDAGNEEVKRKATAF